MPTPWDILRDPATLTLLGLYAALAAWEIARPARPLPRVRGWRLKGLVSLGAYLMVAAYLPLLLSEWLAPLRVFDLTALGTWAGAAVGVLVYEAGAWAWHRRLHRSDVLWRWFHQWHHSAERLDVPGAFWFSPLDMAGWTMLSTVCLTVIVGLSPTATFLASGLITFLAIFQHANVRTPRWLGWLVQRPESHSWHHARGVHAGNYADLPLFDWLLGTLHNPRDFAPEQGLGPGASRRVGELLRGRDLAAAFDAPGVPASAGSLESATLEVRP